MSEERDDLNRTVVTGEGTPRWLGLAVVILAGISILGWPWAGTPRPTQKGTEQALAEQNRIFQQNVDTLNAALAQAEQTNAEVQGELSAVADHLKLTQGQLASARQQTKQINSDYSQKLDNVQSQLATKASADDVTALGGDVNGVKSDLDHDEEQPADGAR